MIGTKFNKPLEDIEAYSKCAEWCNENGCMIVDKGDYYKVVAVPAPSLDELKSTKVTELKSMRDTLEVEAIEYDGNYFDYDEKARDRINAAIIALDLQGEEASLSWTTADNTEAVVTANDLRAVIANVALRSNALHVKYRELKELVKNATSKEELETVVW